MIVSMTMALEGFGGGSVSLLSFKGFGFLTVVAVLNDMPANKAEINMATPKNGKMRGDGFFEIICMRF